MAEKQKLWEVHQQLNEIYNNVKLYDDIKHTLIQDNFALHIENNESYLSYIRKLGIEGSISKLPIDNIPLLPCGLFKTIDLDFKSCSSDEIIKECTSSGTMGTISRIYRDEDTLTNFFSSISSSMELFFGLERTGNHKVLVLGPSNEESGNLWFSYVMSSMALQFETYYYEKNGIFEIDKLFIKIKELSNNSEEVLIIGPPFRIIDLCNYIDKKCGDLELFGNSHIISGGGWKIHESKSLNRESYNYTVRNAFKLRDNTRIRDSFNMVELNSVINECEYNEKHIPPWMDVVARDPRTHGVLELGSEGILSFIDSSSSSYPCYLLSEDYGVVLDGRCKCGKIGKRIKIIRRMSKIESRGCALKMSTGNSDTGVSSKRYYDSYLRNPSKYTR